jgi:hypothetical protein
MRDARCAGAASTLRAFILIQKLLKPSGRDRGLTIRELYLTTLFKSPT